MGFTSKHRKAKQELVDSFLNETGANVFVIDKFLEWLEPQTDNQFWEAFFGKSVDEMARLYQRDLVRHFLAPLRIMVPVSETPTESSEVNVQMREYPALISPAAARRDGGGYVGFDPNSPAMQAELRLQGAQALRGWVGRYGGTLDEMGISVAPLWELIDAMTAKEDADAA